MTTVTEPGTDLSTIFVVRRGGFRSDGIRREVGEVLFADTWVPRRAEAMVSLRNLDPAPYTLATTLTQCPCGRAWEDQAAADKHRCPARSQTIGDV